MAKQPPLTAREETAIISKYFELLEAGDEAGAQAAITRIPLQPWLAKLHKKLWGAQFLINNGYDLSAAEEAFGPDWINQPDN